MRTEEKIIILNTNYNLEEQQGRLQTRKVINVVTCEVVAVMMLIAGACMWGICNDPNTNGCNQRIKVAGQVLTGIGTGVIGVSCCMVCLCLTSLGCLKIVKRTNYSSIP